MPINRNSVILYEGPSELTGDPIVVILTGLVTKSKNTKTKDQLQTWILRSDLFPFDAINAGEDKAICGDCIHMLREYADGKYRRSCFVNVGQAPNSVFKAYRNGSYAYPTDRQYAAIKERKVRLGAYGDPAAVPVSVWLKILPANPRNRTGFSHQWDSAVTGQFNPDFVYPEILKSILMASVDNERQERAAQVLGHRTFRTMSEGETPDPASFNCPSDSIMRTDKPLVSCEDCGACNGKQAPESRKPSTYIIAHGPTGARYGTESKSINHTGNYGIPVLN